MPLYQTPKEEFRVWSKAEIDPVLEKADPRVAPIIALAWVTGARIGEIMAAKPEDFEVAGDEVRIKMMTEKVKGHPLREYTLSISTPYLKDLILPFFEKPLPFKKRRAQQLLQAACRDSGIKFVFHEMRHSRNTYIARVLRASMSEMMDWNGWRTAGQIGTYLIRESPKRFKDMIK